MDGERTWRYTFKLKRLVSPSDLKKIGSIETIATCDSSVDFSSYPPPQQTGDNDVDFFLTMWQSLGKKIMTTKGELYLVTERKQEKIS